jgi:hypothetical protein
VVGEAATQHDGWGGDPHTTTKRPHDSTTRRHHGDTRAWWSRAEGYAGVSS